MSFSILTNVTSLQAQNYLRLNSNFQNQTINQVTSGLRIVNSGDDAAGLAIANGYRSNEAVLTQGIQNANDGLSQLQTADGGLSNISQLLDRARTLATESASGAFTGNRGVLNSEFQSVLGEINRQAQAIGLSQGGSLAKNLNVFVGGGQAGNGISATSNGTIGIDLSRSAVDTQNLGLTGVQASGAAGTDIGAGSSTTSLSAILANATNTGSEATPGYTSFTITGPGFAGNGVNISVNTANLASTSDLVSAINAAITAAGAGGTQQATALKNAGIIAGVNTDSSGKEQLVFTSSSTAFQVKANDLVSNALLGNFAQNAVLKGTDAGPTVATNSGGTSATLTLAVDGGTAFSVGVTAGATTSKAQIVKDLNANTQFSAVATAHLEGDQIVLQSNGNNANSKIQITATTLSTNLGLSATAATAANPSTGASLSTYATAAKETAAGTATFGTAGAGTLTFQFQGAGQTTPTNLSLAVTAGTTVAQAISALQTAVASNAALQSAGITLTTATATDALGFTSTSGQPFSVQVTGDSQDLLGFGSFVPGSGNSFDYSTLTGAAYNSPAGTAAGTANLEFSINGGASSGNLVSVDLGGGDATAATVTGSAVVGPVNIDSTNNTLNLNVNGTGVAITLTSSPTATLNDIATQISTQLNTALGTVGVNYASVVANQLTIATQNKGANQSIELGAGTANATLGLAATAFQQGTARTGASIATALNAAFAANSTLQAAGLTADYGVTAAGKITVSSNNGTFFRTNEYGTATSAEVSGTAALSAAATAALRAGATAGTYNITSSNNIFSVAIDGGATQNITLTQGAARTATQVAADINASLTGAVASVDSNGHIQVLSNTTGASSSVQFLASVAASSGAGVGAVAGPYTITLGTNDVISVQVDGGTAQQVTLTAGVGVTAATIANEINGINGGAGLVGAHASVNGGGGVTITSLSTGANSSIEFAANGTSTANATLGFTATTLFSGANAVDSAATPLGLTAGTSSGTAASGSVTITTGTNDTLNLTIDGTAATVTLAAGATTAASAATQINTQLNTALGTVGQTYATVQNGRIEIASVTTGANSSVAIGAGDANATLGLSVGTTRGTASDLGFGITGQTFTGNIASAAPTVSPSVDAGGASQTAALSFAPIVNGGDNQSISVSAADSTGTQQSLSVTLSNNATSRNGESIDQALNAINTALLQSNNATLQKIVAVKDDSSGTQKIRFLSTLSAFQVSIGSTPDGAGIGSQGTTAASTVSTGGSIADISNITSATAAVTALASAVTTLGNAQAVVGRGENQFNYAVNLAQSQLTNTAAAESSIRDANLAAESANLTKAQILLQAGVAALAQANSAPQAILKLLQ